MAAFYTGVLKGLIRGGTLARGALGELVALGRDTGVVPVVNFANTSASSAVTNTVTETLFDQSYTVPANALRAGSVIRIGFQGIITAVNATDTTALNLRIGGVAGTVLVAIAARNAVANDIFTGFFEGVVRTTGAAGTIVGWGFAPTNANVAGTAEGQKSLASTAINTTITQQIGVSALVSVASAGNSCRLDVLTVEIA